MQGAGIGESSLSFFLGAANKKSVEACCERPSAGTEEWGEGTRGVFRGATNLRLTLGEKSFDVGDKLGRLSFLSRPSLETSSGR